MVSEIDDSFLDLDDSPASGVDESRQDIESQKQNECFKAGEKTYTLFKEGAEIFKKRIKDRELKLHAQTEALELINAKTLQRISEKY